MGEEEPRWFYVGNGQLRAKDSNGWTDEYRDIEGPPKRASAVSDEPAEEPQPVGESGPGWGTRALRSLGPLLSSAAHGLTVGLVFVMVHLQRLDVFMWHLTAVGCQKAYTTLSNRYAARKHQNPDAPYVQPDRPSGVLTRPGGNNPRGGRHRSNAQAGLERTPVE